MATLKALILDTTHRKLGVKSPTASEDTNAMDALNAMIRSWSSEGLMIQTVTRENFPLVINDAEYTIGTGGNFNTVRPSRVVDAFLRDGTEDTPLECSLLKDHNDISIKTTDGMPTRLYYLPEFPLGKILFNFEPDKAYTLFIDSLKTLGTFAATTDVVSVAPEYEEAFIYNLMLRLAPEFNEKISPLDLRLAKDAKDRIEILNSRGSEAVDFSFLPIRPVFLNIETGRRF